MKRAILAAAILLAPLAGQEFKVGSRVGDFSLQDLKGNATPFSSLRGEITVVTFVATRCPVSNAYNDRMKAIFNDYAPRGVKFVFVNANSSEPAQEVAEHAASHGFPFAVYKDEDNLIADRFGATVTPESFVIDSAGVIRYHGSIDDSQEITRVQTLRLRNTLDAVMAGKTVETTETKAFGCSIKRVKKTT